MNFGFRKTPQAWAAPKLVFRDISEQPTFWLDFDGCIVNGDCYWLTANRRDPTTLYGLPLPSQILRSSKLSMITASTINYMPVVVVSSRSMLKQFPLPDPNTPLAREIVKIAKAIYDHAGSS